MFVFFNSKLDFLNFNRKVLIILKIALPNVVTPIITVHIIVSIIGKLPE